MKNIVYLTIAILAITARVAGAMPVTLNVSGGQLIGASGVMVDGNNYNVLFQDGFCSDIFPDCGAGATFDFNDRDAAGRAGQALLDQVFIDNHPSAPLSLFDTDPTLTFGCTRVEVCETLIIYESDGINFLARLASNSGPLSSSVDNVPQTGVSVTGFHSDNETGFNFARFTLISSIPEPSTLAIFALGLAGLGFIRRRRVA